MTDNEAKGIPSPNEAAWISLSASPVQCYGGLESTEISTIQNRKTNQERMFFTYIPASICQAEHTLNKRPQRYPIVMAFHGYGGNPLSEIKKWRATAEKHAFLIVAPKGTRTTGKREGWNAIDCCGDPMTEHVDELDFARGVVATLAQDFPMANASNVVVTGFSNGGFLTSFFGLLRSGKRPQWLKGIVPTGGYQYDTSLYDGALVDPLPMFQHHGGRDIVVRPEGCCQVEGSNKQSKCPFDIGSLRRTCLPVQSAFHLWASNINGCDQDGTITVVEETSSNNEASCMIANHCRSVTKLCIWPDAAHAWGDRMPGVDMVGEFLDSVFSDPAPETPLMRSTPNTKKPEAQVEETLRFYVDTKSSVLILLVAAMAVAIPCLITRSKQPRRKSSNTDEEVVELVGNLR